MTLTAAELNAWWMPFSANRLFKDSPRLITAAEGAYYITDDGNRVLDGICGLWCTNLGHSRSEITAAIQQSLSQLDYAPSFQLGHPAAFTLADKLLKLAPAGFGQVFFTNSGSEACDTALKIALTYHQLQGDTERTHLVGRKQGYHGAGFGGLSVGGINNNARLIKNRLEDVSLLPLPRSEKCFIKGAPPADPHQAEALLEIIQQVGGHRIAAVIVEPVACSGGVLVPSENTLSDIREICTENGILLIVDEVITSMGRLGAAFSCEERFGVVPDIITTAKALTNGTIPLGATLVRGNIHQTFLDKSDTLIDFYHGYTFAGNPAACSAALAVLETMENEKLFTRALDLNELWQQSIHQLQGLPGLTDIRNYGFLAGFELDPVKNSPGLRAWKIFRECFDQGLLVRANGDVIALCPPLNVSTEHIAEMLAILSRVIKREFA
ncbi:omega-aminotransferase AptA [Spongorhabdus nitratireducens]